MEATCQKLQNFPDIYFAIRRIPVFAYFIPKCWSFDYFAEIVENLPRMPDFGQDIHFPAFDYFGHHSF